VIQAKRVYDRPEPTDGRRVLVDRLWPRGLRKESANWDEWLKDAAPSAELRTWYGHDPARFAEFAKRYRAELAHTEALRTLRGYAAEGPLTLLTATRDLEHAQATVLADLLG